MGTSPKVQILLLEYLQEYNSYASIDCEENNNLLLLLRVLRSPGDSDPEQYIKMISDHDFKYTRTDSFSIDFDGGIVSIDSTWGETYFSLECTKNQLIHAIEQWEEVLKTRPKRIMIQRTGIAELVTIRVISQNASIKDGKKVLSPITSEKFYESYCADGDIIISALPDITCQSETKTHIMNSKIAIEYTHDRN